MVVVMVGEGGRIGRLLLGHPARPCSSSRSLMRSIAGWVVCAPARGHRHIEIKYNKVANVVRDTSDAGALEYWGTGAFNSAHHNCFSDMDPGILRGGWLNFLF